MKSLVLTALLVCVGQMLALNPGVKIRIAQKGLEYVNRIVELKVNDRLQSFTIKDLEDYTGNPKYYLKNIQITKVPKISSVMTFRPDLKGLTLKVNDYDVQLSTDYWAQYKILFMPITLSGGLTATFSGVSVSSTIGIDLDDDFQRTPLLRLKTCTAFVGNSKLNFDGGAAWFLNLIKGLFKDHVSRLIQNRICALLTDTINESAGNVVKNTRLTYEINNLFVDYSLTAPVTVNSNYLEIKHKGEVSWLGDTSPLPISPLMPDTDLDDGLMGEILLSQYSASTLSQVAHKHGYLNLDVNPENLPEDKRSYMKTTCPGSVCVGSIEPLIGEKYPDSLIRIKVYAQGLPQTTISTKGISLQMTGILDLFAEIDDSKQSILHGSLLISLDGKLSVQNDLISGNINDISILVSGVQGSLGNILTDNLNNIVKSALKLHFIPNLNEIMAKGLPLPTIPELTYINSKLKYYDGYLTISTDVKYQNID